MKLIVAFILLFNLNYMQVWGKTIEKSFSILAVEERINETRFLCRSDLIDGKLTEIWAVNGQKVSQEQYEEAILNAEREEIRKNRALEAQKRRDEQEFKITAQYALVKKMLSTLVAEIEKVVVRVKNPLLYSYLSFSEHTFNSEMDFIQLQEEVQKAKLLCSNDTLEHLSMCQETFNRLELYPAKLTNLYQDSVNYAIKTCDNTRTLKELLAFVS